MFRLTFLFIFLIKFDIKFHFSIVQQPRGNRGTFAFDSNKFELNVSEWIAKAVVVDDSCQTVRWITGEVNMGIFPFSDHLKIGFKVKNLEKCIPHDLNGHHILSRL